MPKVLRIINRFNLGGPTYNAAYLTKYLAPEFETLLVGGMKDESEDSSEFIVNKLGLEPLIISEMRREIDPKNDWLAYRKLKHIISDFRPDIIHTHASKAGALGRLAGLAMGVPVLVHTFHGHVFHSYFGKFKTEFYKTIERYLAKRSSKIIAISDLQKKELVNVHRICDQENTTVIPLGFDLTRFTKRQQEKRNEFRAHYQVNEDDIAIGIVGRLVPIKNHSLFIKAIAHVHQHSSKRIRAFIIGDGESKQRLYSEAKTYPFEVADGLELNKTATLTFTSWIREVDMAYAGLDIVALTSLNEGTPVSIIEAQAAQLPVVATNVGGIENIVLNNKSALLHDVKDEDAFSKSLLRLVEDDELRKEMSGSAAEFVLKEFSYQRLTKDIGTLYKTLLKTA